MKLSAIRKELGGRGRLVWLEDNYFDGGFGLLQHPDGETEYDDACMYAFERFIDVSETDSRIVRAIGEAFGVQKVFAYQKHLCGTDYVDRESFTKLGNSETHDFYDCNCSFLVMKKKDIEAKEYGGILIERY